jgi:hypothetical protein
MTTGQRTTDNGTTEDRVKGFASRGKTSNIQHRTSKLRGAKDCGTTRQTITELGAGSSGLGDINDRDLRAFLFAKLIVWLGDERHLCGLAAARFGPNESC